MPGFRKSLLVAALLVATAGISPSQAGAPPKGDDCKPGKDAAKGCVARTASPCRPGGVGGLSTCRARVKSHSNTNNN